MIDKTDQTRRDLIEAVHIMRHEHGSLWTPVQECGCESWVDTMLGNYDDIVNERESTSRSFNDTASRELRAALLEASEHECWDGDNFIARPLTHLAALAATERE